MTLGVVIPCYRQERFLPRTVRALQAALAGREWRGAIVLAAPDESSALAELGPRWHVVRPRVERPLTPGAARMLGFASCGGTWVMFVDADVEVDAAWVDRALAATGEESRLAGLWGRLEEWFEDRGRERAGRRDLYGVGDADHDSDYLATLALYRRDALEEVGGYDPRLQSEEDFELGMRLRRNGFVLRSLAPRAAKHWSAPRPSFGEIGRRWRTGLCFGQGQVLRLYLGRTGFGTLLRRQALYIAVLALWVAGAAAALAGPRALATWALAPLALFALMTLRKRSPRLALHSLLTWTVNAAGMLVGFARGGTAPPPALGAGEAAC